MRDALCAMRGPNFANTPFKIICDDNCVRWNYKSLYDPMMSLYSPRQVWNCYKHRCLSTRERSICMDVKHTNNYWRKFSQQCCKCFHLCSTHFNAPFRFGHNFLNINQILPKFGSLESPSVPLSNDPNLAEVWFVLRNLWPNQNGAWNKGRT